MERYLRSSSLFRIPPINNLAYSLYLLRNTVDAQLSLFDRVNCKVLISCPSLNQSLQPLFTASSKVRKVRVPSLDDTLAEDPVPHYEYDQTLESAANEPFLHLHTSGSSGNPKPISGNKKYLASFDTAKLLPQDQGGSPRSNFLNVRTHSFFFHVFMFLSPSPQV